MICETLGREWGEEHFGSAREREHLGQRASWWEMRNGTSMGVDPRGGEEGRGGEGGREGGEEEKGGEEKRGREGRGEEQKENEQSL